MKISLFINTIKYLKPIQLYWRVMLRWNKKYLSKNIYPEEIGITIPSLYHAPIQYGINKFKLFDKEYTCDTFNWHNECEKLKTYHTRFTNRGSGFFIKENIIYWQIIF